MLYFMAIIGLQLERLDMLTAAPYLVHIVLVLVLLELAPRMVQIIDGSVFPSAD